MAATKGYFNPAYDADVAEGHLGPAPPREGEHDAPWLHTHALTEHDSGTLRFSDSRRMGTSTDNEHVCVFGATSVVGAAVIRALLIAGHEVSGASRNYQRAEQWLSVTPPQLGETSSAAAYRDAGSDDGMRVREGPPRGLHVIRCDLLSAEQVDDALIDSTAVVFAAASPLRSVPGEGVFDVGFQNVVRAMRRRGLTRLVAISSAAITGPMPGTVKLGLAQEVCCAPAACCLLCFCPQQPVCGCSGCRGEQLADLQMLERHLTDEDEAPETTVSMERDDGGGGGDGTAAAAAAGAADDAASAAAAAAAAADAASPAPSSSRRLQYTVLRAGTLEPDAEACPPRGIEHVAYVNVALVPSQGGVARDTNVSGLRLQGAGEPFAPKDLAAFVLRELAGACCCCCCCCWCWCCC